MSEVADPLGVMEKRVTALEAAAVDKKTVWLRQPSNALSLFALLLSVATTVLTTTKSNQETIRSKKEELRKLLISLVELRQEFEGLQPQVMGAASSILKAKQGIYVQAAERLASDIKTHVSSYEYQLLAEEHVVDGNAEKAKERFLESVKAATTPAQQAQAYRGLALSSSSNGPMQDLPLARRMFERATAVLTAHSDSYSILLKGINHEAWSVVERQAGFEGESKKQAEVARRFYESLPSNYPSRREVLERLDDRVAGRGTPQGQPPQAPWGAGRPEVRSALVRLSEDEIRYLVETDASSVLFERGVDEESRASEARATRFVEMGLAAFMTPAEVKAAGRKDRQHYDFGIRMTPLYQDVRGALLGAISAFVADKKKSKM